MSNLTKIGIIIIFFGLVILAFQFISLPGLEGKENFRKINTIEFDVEKEQTLFPTRTNQEILNHLDDVRFLIEGRLISRSLGVEFDLLTVYNKGNVINLEDPLFDIKPTSDIYLTKEFPNGYLIDVIVPDDLIHRDFSIEFDYNMIRNHVYNASRSNGFIRNDIVSKSNEGLTITALRKVETSILSFLKSQTTLIISIVLIVLGIAGIIFGVVLRTKKVTEDIGEELILEKEVENLSNKTGMDFSRDIQQKFQSINNRLRRIIKLNKDSSGIDISDIVGKCRILVDNGIKLAKFMVGFTKIKDIADIETQKMELDQLKIEYTKEKDFGKKTEILSKIKAKERVIFFLDNIDKKSEQIDNMIENVDAILESAILSFPSMKKDSTISSQTSISSLKRKLNNEIEIQEKEIDMLNNVTDINKSKQIES